MERKEDQNGLASGDGWHEIAYQTGEEDWPLARVRITPIAIQDEERIHTPNAEPSQPRIAVRLSASLIDEGGAVERIAGKLLLSPESIHSWQFYSDQSFEPDSWLDGCAERVVSDLIKQARGIAAAAKAGLLIG